MLVLREFSFIYNPFNLLNVVSDCASFDFFNLRIDTHSVLTIHPVMPTHTVSTEDTADLVTRAGGTTLLKIQETVRV